MLRLSQLLQLYTLATRESPEAAQSAHSLAAIFDASLAGQGNGVDGNSPEAEDWMDGLVPEMLSLLDRSTVPLPSALLREAVEGS